MLIANLYFVISHLPPLIYLDPITNDDVSKMLIILGISFSREKDQHPLR